MATMQSAADDNGSSGISIKQPGVIMKSLFYAVVATTALSASFGAFAQSSVSTTRAQVNEDLVQLEKAGYKPEISDVHDPQALHDAQARASSADEAGYGAQASTGSRAGRASSARLSGPGSTYFGQ